MGKQIEIHSVGRILSFDVQSPTEIDAAAVDFKCKVEGYFESIELDEVNIRHLYSKEKKEVGICALVKGDFEAIADFLSTMHVHFELMSNEWLAELKQELENSIGEEQYEQHVDNTNDVWPA